MASEGSSSQKKVSIIIPVLGIKEPIVETLEMIPYEKIKKQGFQVEVIISFTPNPPDSDESLEINDPHVKIIEQKERGYGRAYQKGFEHASGDYIVTFDADQTYPAEAIPKLLSKIDDEQIDFLNTNRLQKFEKGAFPKMNYFGNKMFSLFCRLFLRMPFKDSQSGMWFFRKSLLNKLNCIQSGMEFSTEIKIKASRVGKCAEEVIYYRKRESEGTLRWFHDGKRIAKYLLKEFWYTLRGKEMEK